MNTSRPKRLRAKPRMGWDETAEIPDWAIDEKLIDEIVGITGGPLDSDTVSAIEYAGSSYLREKKQRELEPTKGEARAAAFEIADLAKDLADRIKGIDGVTGWELIQELENRPGVLPPAELGQNFLDHLSEDLRDLSATANRTGKRLTEEPNQIEKSEISVLVLRLAEVWINHLGLDFTHTRRASDGEPTSPCGRFVLLIAKNIDEEILASQISTELRAFKEARNHSDSAVKGGR